MYTHLKRSGILALVGFVYTSGAHGAIYRVMPSEIYVLPGDMTSVSVEVETEAGDNVVGFGYFSFAIDLTLTGTAGAMGSDINNIVINEADFDDVANNFLGQHDGNRYIDVSGVTLDVFPPTFGENVGDVVWLFDFDLTIRDTAQVGDTIIITPSEGFLENLVVNENFDNVAPQNFQPATLTVVPEPATAILFLALATLTAGGRRTT